MLLARMVVATVPMVLLVLFCLVVWLIVRCILRWAGRSLKARQDLARGVADVAQRMENLEEHIRKLANQK